MNGAVGTARPRAREGLIVGRFDQVGRVDRPYPPAAIVVDTRIASLSGNHRLSLTALAAILTVGDGRTGEADATITGSP